MNSCGRCGLAEAVARVRSFEGETCVMNVTVCGACLNEAIHLHLEVRPLADGPHRHIEANSLNLEDDHGK